MWLAGAYQHEEQLKLLVTTAESVGETLSAPKTETRMPREQDSEDSDAPEVLRDRLVRFLRGETRTPPGRECGELEGGTGGSQALWRES